MASCKKVYTADFFKKEQKIAEPGADDNVVIQHSTELELLKNTCSGTSCRYLYANIHEESVETSSDEDVELTKFNNEDRIISRLYREVVDDIMARNKLRESKVDSSIVEMKREILQGHKKGFRRFRGINFGKPVNCCGYLRRYAICHTGLVKQIIWNFFLDKNKTFFSEIAKSEIITQNHLKVVSLGGGPGSDLIGFCCALQEIESSIKELDLYVVDIGESWEDVFLTILRKAFSGNFGSLSECMKKTKINAGFKEADLTSKGIFRDKDLLKLLNEADLVLMAKVTSFMADDDAGDLIHNVVDAMKPGAKLIFIDQPYHPEFFRKIESLTFIYHHHLRYELSFKPAKYHSPSIDTSHAHIGIYEKDIWDEDDSTTQDEES